MLMTGYEISGFEKIPNEGPVLLVYYHGAIPIDLYYLMANIILRKRRYLRAVGDRFLFVIPGNIIFQSLLLLPVSVGNAVYCIGLPIHCNYQLAHYTGSCQISRSILNRFQPNLQA